MCTIYEAVSRLNRISRIYPDSPAECYEAGEAINTAVLGLQTLTKLVTELEDRRSELTVVHLENPDVSDEGRLAELEEVIDLVQRLISRVEDRGEIYEREL